MKVKIRLDTYQDAKNFNAIASRLNGNIYITDNQGLKVAPSRYLAPYMHWSLMNYGVNLMKIFIVTFKILL